MKKNNNDKMVELTIKVAEKKAKLEEQLEQIEYIEELVKDMKWYLIKEVDENGEYILDENGDYIKREPKNVDDESYNYREYFKRYNCIMILLQEICK